ncbi:MAG: hypothetical protein HY074_20125 [Deltaproteobacteria bacterium]|nr:hypothetical protein [Deltaproteobacteria bacterium]
MKKSVLATLGIALVFASGCNSQNRIIDHVNFTPSENLEVVRVSVAFTGKIQSDLAGGFPLKGYGYIFVNPFTPAQPFEVGFDLDTSIVNDQDYIRLQPTTVLPNGVPIGIDRALVEVHGAKPISDKFDLYAYLDVLKAEWLGVASIFSFLTDKYFPVGLSVNEVLLRDKEQNPAIIGSVFGPALNSDGTLARAGGVALFANVRKLIEEHTLKAGVTTTFYPEKQVTVSGPNATRYRGNAKALEQLQRNFVSGLNGQLIY